MIEELILSNKRDLPRKNLIYYLPVIDRDTSLELGRLVNLHTDGLMIMNDKPLPLGWTYKLKIVLPKALMKQIGRPSIDDIEAQPVWSKPAVNPSFLDHGLKFVNLSPATKNAITRLMEDFEMPGLESV